MREIAARAGMSLGATYYYFPSKESIVAAYYDHVQDQHRQRALEAFAARTTLKERLRAAYHTKLDVMREDQGLLRALFRFGGDPDHPLSWFGPASRAQRQASMAGLRRGHRGRTAAGRCAGGGADVVVDAAHGRAALFPVRQSPTAFERRVA